MEKTILCFGDSNTHGSAPNAPRYLHDVRWTGVLQKALGTDYYVIEEGLPGRTTVWDDPIEERMSGRKYLPACLETHEPIDLIVLMLGTNDLKNRFSLTAADVAAGNGTLIKIIQQSGCGPDMNAPKVLLVSPPIYPDIPNLWECVSEAPNKSIGLSAAFRAVADEMGVSFFDAQSIISASDRGGMHWEPESHQIFGMKLAEIVRSMLE